jgi:hypothetical protein
MPMILYFVTCFSLIRMMHFLISEDMRQMGFCKNFPFVPYQFILMQKVFSEIRKHGNAGKHLSGGERSMLSGFQEAAQKIEGKDEYALAPFYLFYDTVHTFLGRCYPPCYRKMRESGR